MKVDCILACERHPPDSSLLLSQRTMCLNIVCLHIDELAREVGGEGDGRGGSKRERERMGGGDDTCPCRVGKDTVHKEVISHNGIRSQV